MNEKIGKLTAAVSLAILAAGSLGVIFGRKNDRSMNENREIADLPKISLSSLYDGGFADGLERYFADRFPEREKLVALDAKIEYQIGENIVNGVYSSGDRLLGVPSSGGDFEKSAEEVNRFCEKYPGSACFVCVPTSTGVYGELLPQYMQKNAESKSISALYGALASDIRKIDAYNILKMLNDSYIYYRTDTKWTSYGAYCVYRTVIQKLGFSPIAFDKYAVNHVCDDFQGNLYNRSQYSGVKPDIIDVYRCPGGAEVKSCVGKNCDGEVVKRKVYDKELLDSSYKYNIYLGEPAPFTRIRTNVSNERRLLVITDDFGACFTPFLTQHYSEISVVSLPDTDKSLRDIIDPDKYEQTLFLFGVDSMSDEEMFARLN